MGSSRTERRDFFESSRNSGTFADSGKYRQKSTRLGTFRGTVAPRVICIFLCSTKRNVRLAELIPPAQPDRSAWRIFSFADPSKKRSHSMHHVPAMRRSAKTNGNANRYTECTVRAGSTRSGDSRFAIDQGNRSGILAGCVSGKTIRVAGCDPMRLSSFGRVSEHRRRRRRRRRRRQGGDIIAPATTAMRHDNSQ